MDVSDDKSLRDERNRFVKLAFCRADLLFEMDDACSIVFAAGATEPLFAVQPDDLIGTSFLDLVATGGRREVETLLASVGTDDRIDDEAVTLSCGIQAIAAGYRAREFEDHFFLAVKIVTDTDPDATDAVMDQATFSQAAAGQLHSHMRTDGQGQVTLVRIRNFKELLKALGASDRKSLTTSICDVLNAHSLGGRTAGQISDENFGYAHANDVDTEKVNREIEEKAQQFLSTDQSLETASLTLDADGAGMTEDQTAKALIHAMNQFCSGKAKVSATRLSEALDELMTGTVETVKFIKNATRESDFDLVYMPVCDLRLGRVHHFEALCRFRGPDDSRSTFKIITLAENLGLIVDFDFAVVDMAIGKIDEFLRQGALPSIAVNLSSLSVGDPSFIDRLHKRLDSHPRLKHHLMFELTELADIEDLVLVNNVIQGFREKGFIFCLDDFGAGSASFDYLNALEVDIVKFDGPVVRRACASKRGHDLLMCTTAGVQTVGEMVEDKKIANQLYYCGIDCGQGWYFGKPVLDPFEFEANFAGRK